MSTVPEVEAQYRDCLRASKTLGAGIVRALAPEGEERRMAWAKMSVEAGRVLFQPWNMEILFVLALGRRLRFTRLQEALGVSSRTLSDKLQVLREAGFVERQVFDEQPVRIEYSLTRTGRHAAALATPLFGLLNNRERLG